MPVHETGPCVVVAAETETAGLKAGVRSEVSSVGVAALPSGAARKISAGMLLIAVSLLWPSAMPNPACIVAVPYHCDPKRAAAV